MNKMFLIMIRCIIFAVAIALPSYYVSGLKFDPDVSGATKTIFYGDNFTVTCFDDNHEVFWDLPIPELNNATIVVNKKGLSKTMQIRNASWFEHGSYYCSTEHEKARIRFILLTDVSKRARKNQEKGTHVTNITETLNEAASSVSDSENKMPLSLLSLGALIILMSTGLTLYWILMPHMKNNELYENEESFELNQIRIVGPEEAINFEYFIKNLPVSVPLIETNSIIFADRIGEGNFGEVYRGMLLYSNDGDGEYQRMVTVAIKKLKGQINRAMVAEFFKEVDTLAQLNHPRIINIIGICLRNDLPQPQLSMILEYMPHGDLKHVLDNNTPILTLENRCTIMYRIAEGMLHMSKLRHVHRDLACRNILLGNDLDIKISDLGLSRDIYASNYYKIRDDDETPLPVRWMSPESCIHNKFTTQSDVFSFGVVIWEICTGGKLPHDGFPNALVWERIKQGITLPIHEDWPRDLCELMQLCWEMNPNRRINFQMICDRLQVYDM